MRTENEKGKSMKIVIISDLHGNYEALHALAEAYDELWVLLESTQPEQPVAP